VGWHLRTVGSSTSALASSSCFTSRNGSSNPRALRQASLRDTQSRGWVYSSYAESLRWLQRSAVHMIREGSAPCARLSSAPEGTQPDAVELRGAVAGYRTKRVSL